MALSLRRTGVARAKKQEKNNNAPTVQKQLQAYQEKTSSFVLKGKAAHTIHTKQAVVYIILYSYIHTFIIHHIMKVTAGPSFEINVFGHYSIPVLWHGILISIGFLAGFLLSLYTRQRYGYTVKQCWQMIVLTAVGGFWGARFFYCATHWRTFVENCEALNTRPAIQLFIPANGLTLQGGLLGTALVSYLFCRWNHMSFARMADFGMAPISLGVCFGRVGCFINGCCFGRVMESAAVIAASASGAADSSDAWSRWLYYYLMSAEYLLSAYPNMRWIQRHVHRPPPPPSSRVLTLQHDEHGNLIQAHTHIHNVNDNNSAFTDPLYATQLYAAVGNLLLCIILYQLGRKQVLPLPGQIFALYLILYSLLRLAIEAYRDRPMPSDQMFTSQACRNIYEAHIVCFLCILVGSVYLWRTRHAFLDKNSLSKEKEKKTT